MKPYYDDGTCVIYHGDCRDVLPHLDAEADVVLTDPPYGVGVAEWDKVADWTWAGEIARVMAVDSHLFCFWSVSGIRDFPDIPGLVYERVLVWSKPMTMSNQRAGATWHWEPIWWWRKGKAALTASMSDVLTANPPLFRVNPENVAHPTQKPLAVVRTLLVAGGGELVLDPFMGSGTTLRAAKDLGRRAIGIEIEERYCEIAAKRLSQETLGLDVPA